MKTFLVMAVMRCEVNRRPTRTRDIACIYTRARSRLEAVRKVLAQPVLSYTNSAHALVRWPLVNIMACEPLDSPSDGEEVIGFICDIRELSGKKSQRIPSRATILRCFDPALRLMELPRKSTSSDKSFPPIDKRRRIKNAKKVR